MVIKILCFFIGAIRLYTTHFFFQIFLSFKMTTPAPHVTSPSGAVEDLTQGIHSAGDNVIQDNPVGIITKVVRTLDFFDDSDEGPPPTREEIDAFHEYWH